MKISVNMLPFFETYNFDFTCLPEYQKLNVVNDIQEREWNVDSSIIIHFISWWSK